MEALCGLHHLPYTATAIAILNSDRAATASALRAMNVRPHLSSLGRHLHRSVLRVCLPPAVLRRRLALDGDGAMRPGDLLRVAENIVATGGPRADALHADLDRLHGRSLARFAQARDAAGIAALWRACVHGDDLPGAYWSVLTHPQADRGLRHLAFGDVEMLRPDATAATPLELLIHRRSVSPRRLGLPDPGPDDVERMVEAALGAPDHGRLHPWRVLEFRYGQREALADLFEDEKRRRDPLASQADLRRARSHATEAPCLLAFIVSPRQRKRIPAREQWLAAGAAMGNLLNAAHQLGYGAIMLSGDRCFDEALCGRLGLVPGESLAGFISLGTVAEAPPDARRAPPHALWRCWLPGTESPASRRVPTPADPGRFSDEGIG